VRQNVTVKRPDVRPSVSSVVSAVGIELCLKPVVYVTTSTFDGWPAAVGEVGMVVEDVRGSDEHAARSKAPTSAIRIATPGSYAGSRFRATDNEVAGQVLNQRCA
jgi:hypothetical protein